MMTEWAMPCSGQGQAASSRPSAGGSECLVSSTSLAALLSRGLPLPCVSASASGHCVTLHVCEHMFLANLAMLLNIR